MIERIEINLLPAEYRVHSRRAIFLEKTIMYPVLILVVVVAVLGVWSLSLTTRIAYHKGQVERIDREIAKNAHILEEINTLKAQKLLVRKKIDALQRISVNREKWIRLQEVFCERLPESTWLDRMEENADTVRSVLAVDGRTYSFPEVATYMSELAKSEYFSGVELKTIEQVNAEDGIFKFSLECTLNPDAKLQKTEE